MDSFQKGLYSVALKAYQKGRNCSGKSVTPVLLEAYQEEKTCSEQSITPKYLYEVMSTDVLVTCGTNQAASHLSQVDGFTVSRYIFSQPPSKEISLGFDTAYHALDAFILFGFKFFPLNKIPKQDENLMIRFRDLYKSFFHSNDEKMRMFRGKTIDFWENTTIITDGVASYHQDECCMWNESGVLNHSWNDLGKPN